MKSAKVSTKINRKHIQKKNLTELMKLVIKRCIKTNDDRLTNDTIPSPTKKRSLYKKKEGTK